MSKKIFLSLFLISVLYLLPSSIMAQTTANNTSVTKTSAKPIPAPAPIPCSSTANPEFNSDRPYQASPCGDVSSAVFCSNELRFIEGFEMANKGNCTPKKANGNFLCNPNWDVPAHTLYADLDDSELPILGNTELTKNSQNTTDQIDDATRMNEYASWYLNGINNKAEYGSDKNTDYETINLSGPIQKIMPQAILEARRIATIDTPGKVETYISTVNSDDSSLDTSPLVNRVTEPTNHNQIVVCAKKSIGVVLPTWLSSVFGTGSAGIGNEVPIECYPSAGSSAQGDVYRLQSSGDAKGWDGTDTNQDLINWAAQNLSKIIPNNTNNPVNTVVQVLAGAANRWSKKIPPLPWEFKKPEEYTKAYNEWRGKLCAFIPNPITNTKSLFCVGAWPLINNPYADLFPYVPLANTTDKRGVEYLLGVQPKPSGSTAIDNWSYGETKNAPLYFAHTVEAKDLSSFLNKSYTPKDFNNIPLPATTETNNCSAVNVRTNPGDNLFPGTPHGFEIHDVQYKIINVMCHESYSISCRPDDSDDSSDVGTSKKKRGSGEICTTNHTLKCPAEVIIVVPTNTKNPNLTKIFESTVADSGSTFRKIFPKVEEGAPVSCIADIPGVTDVNYDGTRSQAPRGGGVVLQIKNFPNDGGNTSPQLTFPHLGSVYDYFLKGIQTALRPKGYGEGVAANQCVTMLENSEESGDVCAVATKYNIPCCQLKGQMATETNSGAYTGSGSCSTKKGTFNCCHGGMCGPAQVACTQYDAYAGNDKLDMCSDAGAAELLARALLLKLCQADGKCNSYDWIKWGDFVKKNYKVDKNNYTAVGYFYELQNGCTVTACSQYRWGAGKGYCDSVKSYCETGKILSQETDPTFCNECNEEIKRAGQTPIDCSKY